MSDILIVDDNDDIRELFALILEDEDYSVVGVKSGEDAINLLESGEEFKLILMDVTLGNGMSGIETSKKIKSNPIWRDIPIIAVTGLICRDIEGAVVSHGCDAVLNKPVDDDTLLNVVKRYT